MRTDSLDFPHPHTKARARIASMAAATAVLLLAGAPAGLAQSDGALPLFADDTPLELTLELPLRTLNRNTDERPEHDSVLRLHGADGSELVLDAEIRVRGKSRLERFCDFPPLRVDVNQQDAEGHVFAGQNHVKLVTLCNGRDSAREDLAQEYQIYRALNALTDHSFRVRWAKVEYVDTDSRRRRAFVEPAFFIEEDWEVAERLGLEALDTPSISVDELEPRMSALLGLFQFMIGNSDWAPTLPGQDEPDCCHNAKPLAGDPGGIVLLPYDFDHSGIVDADYALPPSELPIRRVEQRHYRGLCAVNGELDEAIARFNERRAGIERAFATGSEYVDERSREETLEYVAEFYEILNDPEAVQEEIIADCRG